MSLTYSASLSTLTEDERLGAELARDHISILYRTRSGGQLRKLHLAWHKILIHEFQSTHSDVISLPSGLATKLKRQLAAHCQSVAELNSEGGIPYRLDYDENEVLFRDGKWLPDRVGAGLTCATFVLAVFNAQRLPLLTVSEWPRRTYDVPTKGQSGRLVEDEHRQRKLLEKLRTYYEREQLNVKDLDSQERAIGGPRFRPEEVAVGVASSAPPIGFLEAASAGRELLSMLPKDGQT